MAFLYRLSQRGMTFAFCKANIGWRSHFGIEKKPKRKSFVMQWCGIEKK
jgi:hypothetical protein